MTERREFLRQASLIAAGSVAAAPLLAQGTAPAAPAAQPSAPFDMSWTDRVTGRYKMAFDAHEISGGVCLHQARSFLAGYKTIYNLDDKDLSAVIIIRHAAIAMALGDEAWSDGEAAREDELKDPATGEPAKRNPFINVGANARYGYTWPDGALDTLMSRGVIVLACDLALRNFGNTLARVRSIPRQEATEIVNRSLLPGIYRMPTGVFATSHAQQLGCGVLNAV